jgi:integrase-like protein
LRHNVLNKFLDNPGIGYYFQMGIRRLLFERMDALRIFQPSKRISKVKSPTHGLRFHDLRHHAITELAESQASDQTVMSIAGHVSPKMLAHYSHVRMDAKRRALEALCSDGFGGSYGTNGGTKQPDSSKRRSQVIEKAGGRDRDRTGDLLVANEALSQLSYSPIPSRWLFVVYLNHVASTIRSRSSVSRWRLPGVNSGKYVRLFAAPKAKGSDRFLEAWRNDESSC